jgi:hypothetical protein
MLFITWQKENIGLHCKYFRFCHSAFEFNPLCWFFFALQMMINVTPLALPVF